MCLALCVVGWLQLPHNVQAKNKMESAKNIVNKNQVVEFEAEDVQSALQPTKQSLLGRLFMDNTPGLLVIHKIVTRAWECIVKVLEVEEGLLQFFFTDESDRD
ncbi:unnamed protein product [Linum trigynum]|uniref:Uncharacterized protein n=1 Tax=Linum trigynum TaxID=586398 RepID=A0AAV2GLZ0_9ROSI